jgi:chromosome segregation ATPase
MAEEAEEQVENALSLVVCTVEQSSNMRKSLKQKIFDTLSTLRSLFAKLKDSGNRKTSEIKKLTNQVGEMETELKRCRERLTKEYQVSSIGEATEQEKKDDTRHGTPSTATHPEPFGKPTRYVALPNVKTRKNYVEAVQGKKQNVHDGS